MASFLKNFIKIIVNVCKSRKPIICLTLYLLYVDLSHVVTHPQNQYITHLVESFILPEKTKTNPSSKNGDTGRIVTKRIWLCGNRSRFLHFPQFLHDLSSWQSSQEVIAFFSCLYRCIFCDFVYKVFVEIPHRYKVFYPTLYASESENEDAKLFNCVQVSSKQGIRFTCIRTFTLNSFLTEISFTK